jgi:hypothetical protein
MKQHFHQTSSNNKGGRLAGIRPVLYQAGIINTG